jgi:hypothetical protein
VEQETDWQSDYNAAMDSVNLLNAGNTTGMSEEEWLSCVQRNVDHLKLMLERSWPDGYDLTPFSDAIAPYEA